MLKLTINSLENSSVTSGVLCVSNGSESSILRILFNIPPFEIFVPQLTQIMCSHPQYIYISRFLGLTGN